MLFFEFWYLTLPLIPFLSSVSTRVLKPQFQWLVLYICTGWHNNNNNMHLYGCHGEPINLCKHEAFWTMNQIAVIVIILRWQQQHQPIWFVIQINTAHSQMLTFIEYFISFKCKKKKKESIAFFLIVRSKSASIKPSRTCGQNKREICPVLETWLKH